MVRVIASSPDAANAVVSPDIEGAAEFDRSCSGCADQRSVIRDPGPSAIAGL